jgi:hypothetical protein
MKSCHHQISKFDDIMDDRLHLQIIDCSFSSISHICQGSSHWGCAMLGVTVRLYVYVTHTPDQYILATQYPPEP